MSDAPTTLNFDFSVECCDDKKVPDRKLSDKRELLLNLIPEIITATDVGTWCYKMARALKRLFHSNRTELLILCRPNTFDGDLYVMNDVDDRLVKTRVSSNRLVTGAITSG